MSHIAAMLSRLLGTAGRRDAVAPAIPPGSRVYAVGDIHGRADLLADLHQLIHEDAYRRQAPRNVVVYLGDYIDRGEGSNAVIDRLLDEPLPSFERVCLRGNHEDCLLSFLDKLAIGPGWLSLGGMATLQSYGIAPPSRASDKAELQRIQHELARRLPDRHRRFLSTLVASHEEGDYFFVHAGVRPGVPLDRQSDEDLLWIRDAFLRSDAEFGKIVVHGHTIVDRPDVQRNRIGIDTGAYVTGKLTALVIEGTDWGFLQT